jgi:hypothetical protein
MTESQVIAKVTPIGLTVRMRFPDAPPEKSPLAAAKRILLSAYLAKVCKK